VVATAFVAFGLGGCSHQGASADEDERASGAAAKAEVTLTRITRADISQALTLTGTAAALPNQDVKVSSLVAGRIASLKVAEGDRVHAGEVVATLDNRPYKDQLQQAEAAAAQAKASYENAKLSRTRNEDLFQRGIAARKDMEDARTQEAVAAAAMRQAEAALEIARLQLSRTQIVSPLDGQVVKRFVSDGEQVDGTAAQPIAEVANLRELEFLGSAPAMYLSKLHPGEAVTVQTETVPGKNFAGHVVAISPAVDPATGVGNVRIRIPNPGALLRIGTFLTAQVAIETHAKALTVPAEAIYRDPSGTPRVYVVNGDSAAAVGVALGIQNKDRVELLPGEAGGVKEGDTVILTGGYGLEDKAKIQAKPQANSPATNQPNQ
jgi:RND family efflux transporter MFP subunit